MCSTSRAATLFGALLSLRLKHPGRVRRSEAHQYFELWRIQSQRITGEIWMIQGVMTCRGRATHCMFTSFCIQFVGWMHKLNGLLVYCVIDTIGLLCNRQKLCRWSRAVFRRIWAPGLETLLVSWPQKKSSSTNLISSPVHKLVMNWWTQLMMDGFSPPLWPTVENTSSLSRDFVFLYF